MHIYLDSIPALNPAKRLLRLPHLFLQYPSIQHPQQRILTSPNIDRQQDTKPQTIIVQQPIMTVSSKSGLLSPVSTNHINRRSQIPCLPSYLISLFVNLVCDFRQSRTNTSEDFVVRLGIVVFDLAAGFIPY